MIYRRPWVTEVEGPFLFLSVYTEDRFFFTLHFSQNCALMHGNKGCPCRILASLDYAIYCKQISLKFGIRFYTPRSVKGMFQVVFIAAKHYATLHR